MNQINKEYLNVLSFSSLSKSTIKNKKEPQLSFKEELSPYPPTNSVALVIWGKDRSGWSHQIGKRRILTWVELTPHQSEIITGALLGDGTIRYQKINSRYPHFSMGQSLGPHQEYLWLTYFELGVIFNSWPIFKSAYDKRYNKTYYSTYIWSRN